MTRPPPVVVDTSSPIPPYEQIRRQITAHVATGTLAPGTALPSVRQLAADLSIAPGTVARSYHELEADGIVVTRPRGGTRVADEPPVADAERLDRLVRDAAVQYVLIARLAGADNNRVLEAVKAELRNER